METGGTVVESLNLNINALRGMHRFGDIMEDAIKSIDSEIASLEAIRDSRDCIGRHWYGMRCQVTCKRSGVGFYLHMGLIYYPDTRVGLMIEVDEQNNGSVYGSVLEHIEERPEFEINRVEPEYFKLFMPDHNFSEMSGKARGEQVKIMRTYIQSGVEAIVQAAYGTGFDITYKNMQDALNLANAFDKALTDSKSEISKIKVNYSDKDNFGQYAMGFRYYLSDQDEKVTFYAYFGAIYSYKKDPAGIFAEIDWFSNQQDFDQTYQNMSENKAYDLSIKDPKFIKLFMPADQVELFNGSNYETQIKMLTQFLTTCNDEMVNAYKKGEK